MKTNFNLTKSQIVRLSASFNELVCLSSKATGNIVYRADIFRKVINRAVKAWNALAENTKQTPYSVVVDVIGKESNDIIGYMISNRPLADKEAAAYRVGVSTSTGKVAYWIGDPLPVLPGDPKMVKSLAKRLTRNGGAFAVKTQNGNMSHFDIFSVAEKTEKKFKENGEPVEVKTKVATKETSWIRLVHKSESSFKKGIVRGLKQLA